MEQQENLEKESRTEAVPQEKNEDDEISLIDLLAVLMKHLRLIIGLPFAAAIFIVIFSIVSLKLPPEKSYLPNKYDVTANMLITDSSGGGAKISGSMAALASLARVSFGDGGGSSNSSLVLYLASSNPFLDAIIDEFDLMADFDEKVTSPRSLARDGLKEMLKCDFASSSGVFSITATSSDPEKAVGIVNFAVDWLASELDALGVDNNKITKENLEKNIEIAYDEIIKFTREAEALTKEIASGNAVWTLDTTIEQTRLNLELNARKEVYTQLKSQLELLKVNMQSETPVFQILERPSVPDRKSGPGRGKICIIVTLAAGFVAVFLAFMINAIENMKKDPEIVKKLSIHEIRENRKQEKKARKK